VAGRRGRRLKQPLDELTEKTEYWRVKDETLALTLWGTRYGGDYEIVVIKKE